MNLPASHPLLNRDIRNLAASDVCTLREWLDQYLRLELDNPKLTDSDLLMQVLVRSSREYESDLGVFRTEL